MGKMLEPGVAALAVALACGLAGCGTPGAPLPPSLNLPERATDLAAVRTGNQVALTWTMPKRNTDHLLLNGDVSARICRKEGSGACQTAGGDLLLTPGSAATFTDTLPPALAAGAPRPLSYFVEIVNRKGRSAGLSSVVVVLAGEAPAPVAGLRGEMRKDGIVLSWMPGSAAGQGSSPAAIRLHRKLLTPPAQAPQQGLLSPQPERVEESLYVENGSLIGRAIDKDTRFGQVYEYRAQRVIRVSADGNTLELAGPLSEPLRIEAQDIFPPDPPAGLAAVAVTQENGAAIDLSWQPNTEPDLAGYAVYRREGDAAWQRISPPQPLPAPAFHDTQVEAGRTYHYAVTAIDQSGHESARSAEAEETVPVP